MLKINSSDVVCMLVENLLPRGSGQDKGLHIEVEANMVHPKTRKEKRKYIHFIFQRPMNYTKVFCAVLDRPASFNSLNKDDFKFLCDHDSCWRDSVNSKLWEVYFELTKNNDELAPVAFEHNSYISMFCPNFLMVKIVPDNSPDDKFMSGYKKKIEHFERWV